MKIEDTTSFKLGKVQGALDFVEALRGTVEADVLMKAWADYSATKIEPVLTTLKAGRGL